MMYRTRTLTLAVILSLASPSYAQDVEEDAPSLMERGALLFLEGLLQEMEPALEDLQGFADEVEPALRDFADSMGPALRDLMSKVEDWNRYEAPELLENGDIIIRRKPDPEPDEVDTEPPDGEIEI